MLSSKLFASLITLSTSLSIASSAAVVGAAAKPHQCSASQIQYPAISGLQFLSKTAVPVYNYPVTLVTSTNVGFWGLGVAAATVDFCNVTMIYTHPGKNDAITVTVSLPLPQNWNQRFVAAGGGGWATGYYSSQVGPTSEGFSSATTDGGHTEDIYARPLWGLTGNGTINYNLLEDFASVALADMIRIGKHITKQYYGKPAKYAYWSGCSTGGRQGLMVAQRYPKLVDGILAAAPAINWAKFVPAEYWPQLVMNQLNKYPQECELTAITQAAIAACDALDGVTDGIVSAPNACHFDPRTVVGKQFNCSDTNLITTISSAAAEVALKTWQSARDTSGRFLWYGLSPSAPLNGLANTACNAQGKNCTGSPFITADWISIFLQQNANFDPASLSHAQYDRLSQQSIKEYATTLSTDNPDLSAFKKAGGKMITWHGLDDELIFPNGTIEYYNRVLKQDPDAKQYYRFFEAPGLEHCAGGNGFFPNASFSALVKWVEEGEAPETLLGSSLFRADGVVNTRPLCVYPKVAKYMGGDVGTSSSYECAASFT